MTLLAAANYDPATAATKVLSSLAAMVAFDTTNLRLGFTVPSNGAVLVRQRVLQEGTSANPAQITLGVLQGATLMGRVTPIGGPAGSANAATHYACEALYVVSGLTPAASLTWDSAYGIERGSGTALLKYGGPDDTTTDNAYGGNVFEIWSAVGLLGSKTYDPSTKTNKSCAANLALTALDTTNLRVTFTAPSTGNVVCRLRCAVSDNTGGAFPQILLGILEGSTIRGRQSPIGVTYGPTGNNNVRCNVEASFTITGLTPGNSYTYDAAYGVESAQASSNIVYGGPNSNASDDDWGAFCFEVWQG